MLTNVGFLTFNRLIVLKLLEKGTFSKYHVSCLSLLKHRKLPISIKIPISDHVLLNLLNELGKRDKMQGLLSILSLFRNEFYKLNYTSTNVRYYLSNDIKITLKSHFWRKNVIILSFLALKICYVCNVVMGVITFPANL